MPDYFDKAELYLKRIHNKLTKDDLIDLHTFMYWIDLESCPICNEWLIRRTNPELKV